MLKSTCHAIKPRMMSDRIVSVTRNSDEARPRDAAKAAIPTPTARIVATTIENASIMSSTTRSDPCAKTGRAEQQSTARLTRTWRAGCVFIGRSIANARARSLFRGDRVIDEPFGRNHHIEFVDHRIRRRRVPTRRRNVTVKGHIVGPRLTSPLVLPARVDVREQCRKRASGRRIVTASPLEMFRDPAHCGGFLSRAHRQTHPDPGAVEELVPTTIAIELNEPAERLPELRGLTLIRKFVGIPRELVTRSPP